MAFRYPADSQHLGALVTNDPKAALLRLQGLFREYRTRAAVSRALQVDERTLARWIRRLIDSGYSDPRDASNAPRRGRAPAAA